MKEALNRRVGKSALCLFRRAGRGGSKFFGVNVKLLAKKAYPFYRILENGDL